MMLDWLGAVLLAAGFIVLLYVFRLVERAQHVMLSAHAALGVVRNGQLTDAEKEKQLQGHALRLFGLFLQLAAGGMCALLVPVGAVWILSQLGWLQLDQVLATAISLEFLTVSTFAFLVIWRLRRGV